MDEMHEKRNFWNICTYIQCTKVLCSIKKNAGERHNKSIEQKQNVMYGTLLCRFKVV